MVSGEETHLQLLTYGKTMFKYEVPVRCGTCSSTNTWEVCWLVVYQPGISYQHLERESYWPAEKVMAHFLDRYCKKV